MRAHRSIQGALCRELRAVGAAVDLERIVPELSGRAQGSRESADAILDLYVTFPGVPERFLVDVTVRSPHAARFPDAATRIGQPSAAGAKEKFDLYGPAVLPLAFESYGRIGAAGLRTIATLAVAAASSAFSPATSSRFQHLWRAACERALLYASADVALLALGADARRFAPHSRGPHSRGS